MYNYGVYKDFIVLESVKGQTFSQYIKSESFCTKDFISILIQLSLSLYISQKKFSFVHNDLTPWNIMIKTLPCPITIDYCTDEIHYTVKTHIIPVIIDLGRSHLVHNSKHYGNINMFSSSTIQDIVTLLVTSISDICNFDLDKSESGIIVKIANFLSGTTYCKQKFSEDNIGALKFFFTKAGKYTELISSDKYELENRNPLDFVNYLLTSFKIPSVNIRKNKAVSVSYVKPIDDTIFLYGEQILDILRDETISNEIKETVKYISKIIYQKNLNSLEKYTSNSEIQIQKYISLCKEIVR